MSESALDFIDRLVALDIVQFADIPREERAAMYAASLFYLKDKSEKLADSAELVGEEMVAMVSLAAILKLDERLCGVKVRRRQGMTGTVSGLAKRLAALDVPQLTGLSPQKKIDLYHGSLLRLESAAARVVDPQSASPFALASVITLSLILEMDRCLCSATKKKRRSPYWQSI